MGALGTAKPVTRTWGLCTFGHALKSFLPEAGVSAQPLQSHSAKLLLTCDTRIDNRLELADALGVPAGLSDAELILLGWERWGTLTPGRMIGDFALAIWDEGARELMITRSPASSRTLFYHAGPAFAAFATLPQPLTRLIPRALNVPEMARRLDGGAYFGNCESLFAGIYSIDPGTLVRITESSVVIDRYWHPGAIQTVERHRADAAEELKWHLGRAVAACLRRTGGPVASHLSGGRDSGAVTACAAAILQDAGEPLHAFTSAPRAGFPKTQGRYLLDESSAASAVASQFSNIRHFVSRSSPVPFCGALDRASLLHAAPMGNPANLAYWTRLQSEAAQFGSRVLLTGANGNFSVSLGGLGALPDVVREDGLGEWWKTARAISRSADLPWKTLLNQSFGHRLPASLHRRLRNGVYGPPGQEGFPCFSARLRDAMRLAGAEDSTQPLASYRARAGEIYQVIDYPDNIGEGLYGIDLRDPTADRRLIEFCLSLPAKDIVGSHGQRPIYDLAFAKLVPEQVRGSRLKGFQGADWFEIYDPEEIRTGVRRYGEKAIVREFVDIPQIERLLDVWPTELGQDLRSYSLYANHLLIAVALASWLNVHF